MAKKKKKGKKKEKSVNHIVTPFITRVPGYRNELKKKNKSNRWASAVMGGDSWGCLLFFENLLSK